MWLDMEMMDSKHMWAQYRKWKHVLFPVFVLIGLLLMRGEPEESPRWYWGIGLATFLGLAYVGEEVFWIVRNRGRPCPACGQMLRLKPFALHLRCPHCGEMLE